MKTKALIPLVILGTVVWFVPSKPIQALRALHLMVQTVSPGSESPDAELPPVKEVRDGKETEPL